MLIDGRAIDGQTLDSAICIIGAGAAGISLALEFLDSGISVIVIESGGFDPEKKVLDLNEGETSGLPYSVESSRLRYFGGTTNHWEGQCGPFPEEVFQQRYWIKYSGWPFGRTLLDPFYERAHRIVGIAGDYYQNFLESLKKLPGSEDFRYLLKYIANFKRLGQTYREPLINSKNVNVVLYANLTGVQTNDARSQVESLTISTLEGQHFTVKAKQYVLACGALENARLMLAFNIGNKNDLVGRYFMEHPRLTNSATFFNFAQTEMADLFSANESYIKLIQPSPLLLEKHRMPNWAFRIIPMPPKPMPAIAKLMENALHSERTLSAFKIFILPEQTPDPDNRVTLSSDKKDALNIPQLHLHWYLPDQQWETIQAMYQLLASYLSSRGQGIMHREEWMLQSKGWPKKIDYSCHHMGTTRMHRDEKQGVVDADCKVHGMDNFYVAGSSVFPTGSNMNPTLTIIALAVRLADHLKVKMGFS